MANPRKRPSAAYLKQQQQAIIDDMESRLPPDTEDPEAQQARIKKFGAPPGKAGARVRGVKNSIPPELEGAIVQTTKPSPTSTI